MTSIVVVVNLEEAGTIEMRVCSNKWNLKPDILFDMNVVIICIYIYIYRYRFIPKIVITIISHTVIIRIA